MTIPTRAVEFWLAGWNKTHNGGSKVTFVVKDEDLEYFEAATIRKGKVAGQRYVAQMVQLQDDDTPDPKSLEPPPHANTSFPSGHCGEAVKLCKSPTFQEWLIIHWGAQFTEDPITAGIGEYGKVICRICGVTSRKELDTDSVARHKFITLIRDPFRAS